MISPFQLELPNAAAAYAVHVTEVNELHSAVNAMGLRPPRATVVVVGGAAGLDDADHASIRKLFVSGVVPVMEEHGAVGSTAVLALVSCDSSVKPAPSRQRRFRSWVWWLAGRCSCLAGGQLGRTRRYSIPITLTS